MSTPDITPEFTPALLEWLRQAAVGISVEPLGDPDNLALLRPASPAYAVVVHNGEGGHNAAGAQIAVCHDELHAELVAAGLWALVREGKSPEDPPSPLSKPCRDCGAEAGRACRPMGDDPAGLIGYHDARYADAGWPMDNG